VARFVVHGLPKAESLDPAGQAIVGIGRPWASPASQMGGKGKRFDTRSPTTVSRFGPAEIADSAVGEH